MKRISEYLFCWALGGTLYYAVELLFRGYSHWSMFLLGGFCFLFFAWQGLQGGWKTPLWKQVLRCTIFPDSVRLESFLPHICSIGYTEKKNHSFMCYKESVFYGKFVLILKTLPLKSNASCCTDHVFSS